MTQPTLKNPLYMQPTMVLYFKPVASTPQTKVMRNCPIADTPVKNRRVQKVGKFVTNAVAVMEQARRKAFIVNAILRPKISAMFPRRVAPTNIPNMYTVLAIVTFHSSPHVKSKSVTMVDSKVDRL